MFSQKKQQQTNKQTNKYKTKLDGKNFYFHDVLYHFFFLYFPLHFRRRLPYITIDDSIEGL